MRLIDTNEFLQRVGDEAGMEVERRINALDFRDDETTEYADLSGEIRRSYVDQSSQI